MSWSKFNGPRALYFRSNLYIVHDCYVMFRSIGNKFSFLYQLKMVGVGFNYTNPIICSLYVVFFRIELLYKLKLKMLYESF